MLKRSLLLFFGQILLAPSFTAVGQASAPQIEAASLSHSDVVLGIGYFQESRLSKEQDNSKFRKAIESFDKAASLGDPLGMCWLGVCMELRSDPSRAQELYKKGIASGLVKLAQNGDPYAQAMYGDNLFCGDGGLNQNKSEGFAWLLKGANAGIAGYQTFVGTILSEGNGVDKDSKQAFDWFRKAAEQHDATGQCKLGSCYLTGDGVEKDTVRAREFLIKAAEQGLPDAVGLISKHFPKDLQGVVVQCLKGKCKEVLKRTVDDGAGKDGAPSTEDLLLGMAQAFEEGEVIIKRGQVLIASQGGRIPSGTRVYPVKISGEIKGSVITITKRFWKDEFGEWNAVDAPL